MQLNKENELFSKVMYFLAMNTNQTNLLAVPLATSSILFWLHSQVFAMHKTRKITLNVGKGKSNILQLKPSIFCSFVLYL